MSTTPPTTRPRLPTPTLSSSPTSPVIDYSPHTVPYNEPFENALMNTILHPSHASPRAPPTDPPMISASALPIPLTSPLRTHASPIPGLLVTHPGGYHTGGPGPSTNVVNDFAARFVREQQLGPGDAGVLGERVDEAVRKRVEDVKARMRGREEACRRNEAVERELEDLRLSREAEVRVLERMKGRR